MKIKREIDTTKATYDLTGLTHEQFTHLFQCYEKQQWYVYCNRKYPEKGHDELLDKMREMAEKSIVII